jgi:pimeloyl-[acyl-carrier protein] methyl ester esterase
MKKIRVILLPGLHGTEELFKPFLDHAPPDFDLSVVSFPTHQVLSYEALAEIVQERLQGTAPIVLLGESFSGALALMVAARKPQGLVGVILVASFVLSPAPAWLRLLPWNLIFRVSAPIYALRALLANSKDAGAIIWQLRKVLKGVLPSVLANRVRSALTVNATEALRLCPTPILYLAGSHDRIVRRRNLMRLLSHRPDVVICNIEAPHFVLQCAPIQSWQAITKFIHKYVSSNPS